MQQKAKWLLAAAVAVALMGAGGLRAARADGGTPAKAAPAVGAAATEKVDAEQETSGPETDNVQHDAQNETGDHQD